MKKLISNIKFWLNKNFGTLFAWLKKNAEIAVLITEQINKAVQSPAADIVTEIIPGEWDNGLKIILRKIVPKVLFKVAVWHGIMQESDSPLEATTKLIEYLKTVNKSARASLWIRIAGELTVALSDGHVALSQGVIWSQVAFNELIEKNNEA